MEVKNHWIRILILAAYFILVFIVCRIIDLVLWYHHGYIPTDLVDPIVLNVRQLKLLLDSRGVSYTGVLEKQQLVELLNDSALVVKSEVDDLNLFSNNTERLNSHPPPSSLFTGGIHFNEKVEDTKDSVWLVQVMPATKKHHEPLLDDYSWRYLKHHLAPFAIQTGVFDCALDRELCIRKNWLEPILLLALPRGNRPKDHVIIRTSNTPKIHNIINWVKEQLSIRVNKISSLSELEDDWLSPTDSKIHDTDIKVILFTHLLHTPLFFAALSIKFTGRIKFGIFSMRKDDPEQAQAVKKYLAKHQGNQGGTITPTYLVVTPEHKHVYGSLRTEHFNLFHMNLFLKLVQPEMNDVFIVALLLTNMLVTIDLCQIRERTKWLYLIRAGFTIISYNLFLFMLSLISHNLSWTSIHASIATYFVSTLRYITFSTPGALIRSDVLLLYKYPMLFMCSFVLFGYLVREFLRTEPSEWFWDIFPIGNSFIINSLFRPIETPRHHFSSDVNLSTFDLRFEQLVISRSPRVFNVPNLWLQPSPRVDYLSDLPVFEYRGWRECTHGSMALVEQVMDGDDPNILHRRPNQNKTKDADERESNMLHSNVPHRELSNSNLVHTDVNRDVLRRGSCENANPPGLSNLGPSGSCDYLECRLIRVQECAICLEAYEMRSLLLALPCAHHFHKTCVMSWLRRGHAQCPVCRWPAYKQKYEFSF